MLCTICYRFADIVLCVGDAFEKWLGWWLRSLLRQQINALSNSDQTNRIRLNKQLNSQQRQLREDRVNKVNIQREMDVKSEEKAKQAEVLPIVSAALEILEAGLGDGAWNTPLHRACQVNNDSHVKSLLEHGALPDAADIYGDTPLHMAVAYGHHETIKHFTDILAERDPDTLVRTLATHNMFGQRPTDLAQDPMCRVELRKAILRLGRTIETPFMRIGIKSGQKMLVEHAFSQTNSVSRTASVASAGMFQRSFTAQRLQVRAYLQPMTPQIFP
jgi:hypothetical protein